MHTTTFFDKGMQHAICGTVTSGACIAVGLQRQLTAHSSSHHLQQQ